MDFSEDKRNALKTALKRDGYCVIPNVISAEDCDKYVTQYKAWLESFSTTNPIHSLLSLVKDYAVGHSEAAWAVRLAAKPVFAAVWDTEKLLSSIDAVAIAPPPQKEKDFDGEATTEHDYCLRVMEKSHNCHQLFFNSFPSAREKSIKKEFYKLTKKQVDWYKDQGCAVKCVAVPKGGMVLWDSRVIHDSRPPIRKHCQQDRWRFVSFVCMTPAAWASKPDLAEKRHAYEELLLTNHWASQKMRVLPDKTPTLQKHTSVKKLPNIAKSVEARQLAGVESYNFHDDEPNDAPPPVWIED